MGNIITSINTMNNYLNEIEQLYHKASVKLNISDSRSIVLYFLYNMNYNCELSEIYKNSGISKQTINSAIRELEKENIIYLECIDKKSKRIIVTDSGKSYIDKTISPLCQAEINAFSSWNENEINEYINLLKKNYITLLNEFEKIKME